MSKNFQNFSESVTVHFTPEEMRTWAYADPRRGDFGDYIGDLMVAELEKKGHMAGWGHCDVQSGFAEGLVDLDNDTRYTNLSDDSFPFAYEMQVLCECRPGCSYAGYEEGLETMGFTKRVDGQDYSKESEEWDWLRHHNFGVLPASMQNSFYKLCEEHYEELYDVFAERAIAKFPDGAKLTLLIGDTYDEVYMKKGGKDE